MRIQAIQESTSSQDIIAQIKSQSWDTSIQRPGFLQSKAIVLEAEIQPLQLVPGLTVSFDSELWVKETNLYHQETLESFAPTFKQAFKKNPSWPQAIVSLFHDYTKEKDDLQKELGHDWSQAPASAMIATFTTYVSLLKRIQNYYAIAIPLTNFCETELRKKAPKLLDFATPYERLDVDKLNDSLQEIKRVQQKDKKLSEEKIDEHLKKFAWIKTAYNIIKPYTQDEVRESLAHTFPTQRSVQPARPESQYSYLLDALRIGIFLRNRLKELSQQLWFAADPLLIAMATHLNLPREDFLQLRPAEVVASFKKGKSTVTPTEIQARHQGFVQGYLNRQEILLTGPVVEEVFAYYNTVAVSESSEITGTPACRGIVQGTVRIIKGSADFGKLESGNILVTSMTTPDFIVIMKKAAAIVTDEGGLSCHAAIVSRELGVPCIIGTKIATQVLKDGDEVEVDANKGIVRKL